MVEFGSAELRYAFFANKRVSPYAVGGFGRGVERPDVNEYFPHGIDRNIVVIYYGAGARVPIHRRLDAFVDWRLIITGDDAAEMAVWGLCAAAWPSVSKPVAEPSPVTRRLVHQPMILRKFLASAYAEVSEKSSAGNRSDR